jgi:hypothetical protein
MSVGTAGPKACRSCPPKGKREKIRLRLHRSACCQRRPLWQVAHAFPVNTDPVPLRVSGPVLPGRDSIASSTTVEFSKNSPAFRLFPSALLPYRWVPGAFGRGPKPYQVLGISMPAIPFRAPTRGAFSGSGLFLGLACSEFFGVSGVCQPPCFPGELRPPKCCD